MANLHYEILTDPAPLQVSGVRPDEQSTGKVYIVVSNPGATHVDFDSLDLEVPGGNGDGALTPDTRKINAGPADHKMKDWNNLAFQWNGNTGIFMVSTTSKVRVRKGEYMVLVLESFPVSSKEGLVLLKVTEESNGGSGWHSHYLTLSLLKQAPKVPHNFRPEKSLVDAGEDVVLRWAGPSTLTYQIKGPDGTEDIDPKLWPDWQWSPKAGTAPKRDATYTLIATSDPKKQQPQQPGYFLTTTVHLSSPEFKKVTATEGMKTPWVQGTTEKGRISFTAQGAEFHVDASGPATITAQKAELDELRVAKGAAVGGELIVKGKVDAQDELHVARNATVGGNLTVNGKLELDELLVIRKATIGGDLSVNGRADVLGGLQSAGKTVIGDDLTINGRVDAGGELHAAGKTVVGGDLDVNGESVFTGMLNANGLLAVRNQGEWIMKVNDDQVRITRDFHVHGGSWFSGKMNANGLLAVRNGDAGWLMHVDDDKVAIQGDLRVHGALRSDS